MSDVLKAMEQRSSTRGFTEQKLTEEELDSLLRAGLQAPTAANKQEIHITVVDGKNPILTEMEKIKNQMRGIQDAPNNFYYGAPTVLFLSGDTAFHWSNVDAGIAVENIALAAEGLGLGSLIIGCVKDALSGSEKHHFARALKFPDGYEYKIAIAIGHKAVSKEPHEYSMENNVSYV